MFFVFSLLKRASWYKAGLVIYENALLLCRQVHETLILVQVH